MPLQPVSGFWSRSAVETDAGLDWNAGAYPQQVKLPPKLERHIKHARDPRVALTYINGPYVNDPAGRDVWKSSYRDGQGDCDSKAISAMDICYSYMRKSWIPCIAMGNAWLSDKDNPSERAVTPHAYNVFLSRTSNRAVIGEPTYTVKDFNDMGPGSGHIIEVEWLLAPGASIRIGVANDMGKDVGIHTRNEVLIEAIERETATIKPELNRAYDEYVSPLTPAELEQVGTNANGMPILAMTQGFETSSKRVQ